MKKKSLAVVGTLAVVAVLGLTGFAGGGCGHHRGPRDAKQISRLVGARVDNALDELDATEAQRQQVKVIQDRLTQEVTAMMQSHQESKGELLGQWESASPDRAKVHALVDEKADAMRAMAHKFADAAIELHGILTPAQRAELTEKVKSHHGR